MILRQCSESLREENALTDGDGQMELLSHHFQSAAARPLQQVKGAEPTYRKHKGLCGRQGAE
jgi:hypothetical protein